MAGYTKTNHSDRITTLVDNLNTVSQDVGNLTELNTLVDSDLTSAINELHDSIDGISSRVDSIDTFVGVEIPLATVSTTVVGSINELHDSIGTVALTTTSTDLKSAINEHETDIGNMTFTGLSATNISAAIRELRTELGDHTALTTTATANVVAAINEINSELYNNPDGSGSNFTTTAASVEGAINELDSDVGAISSLTTTDKANVVSAINEVDAHVDSNYTRLVQAESDIDSNYTRLVQAESDIDSNYTRLTQAESDIDSNYTRLTTAESDIITLDNRVDSIDGVLFANPGDSLNTTSQTVILAINEINSELHGITDGDGTDLTTTANTFAGAINELDSDVGNISLLSTDDKTNVVSAINEVDAHVDSNYTRLVQAESDIDSNYTRLVQAESDIDSNYSRLLTAESDIVTLDRRVDSIDLRYGALDSLDKAIGSGLNLTTAINEVYAFAVQIDSDRSTVNTRVGSLSNLNTSDQTSTVNAINELHDSIDGFINHGYASLLSLYVDSSLIVPVGTTANRPLNAVQGDIRYNISTSSFEGYGGSNWGSLGGVKDVDGDTYIQTEISAGTDSDVLNFYTAGNLALTLTNDSAIFTGNIAAQNASFAKITGDSATFTNLTVSGTTTYVNTETLEIDDNIIELNSNVTGAPTENAGIEVERGTSENVRLQWNETTDRWQATDSDGPTFNRNLNIVREKDLVGGNHITITNSTFDHKTPAAEDPARSSNNSGRVYIQDLSVDSYGHIRSISTATETYSYSLPTASNTVLGGSKLVSNTTQTTAANSLTSTASRTYAVQHNASDQLVVNVPWIDTDTDTDTWQANTSSQEGYVSSGSGQANKVWRTDASGNPAWRNEVDNYSGTVTSVGITAGNLIDVSGSPVTSSGSITVNVDLTELTTETADYNPAQDFIAYIDNGTQKKKAFGTFDIKNSSGTVIAKLLRAD